MGGRTVLSSLSASLLDAVAESGFDAEKVRRAAGIDRAVLQDPDARIPFARHIALWEAIAALHDEIGLAIGRRLGRRALGVVGHVVASAGTIGAAFELLDRYREIVLDEALPRAERRDGTFTLRQSMPERMVRLRHPAEAQTSATLTSIRALVAEEIVPLRVTFQHARPKSVRVHDAIFRCALEWKSPRTEIVFDDAVATRAVASGDRGLLAYLQRQADAQLATLPRDVDPRSQVQRALLGRLADGEPHVAAIASTLGTSVRTLHRRLSEQGTSYAAVLDDVRRERALALVADASLTLYEVAWLLGYSEQAAFTRAFKRWTGSPPAKWRTK